MGDADVEEQKKNVLPYMQRAQEIQNADPKVAYYCRLYGVEQALKIEKRAKEITALLSAAIGHMEKEKPALKLNAESDRYHCEAFALRIFKNADKVDCSGRADANTAKAYYAASFFIEILNQFGPLDPDLLEKQRYAAWRAFDIRKALREGRQPTPPEINQATGTGQTSSLPPAYADSVYGASETSQSPHMQASSAQSGFNQLPPPPSAASAPAPAAAPAHEQETGLHGHASYGPLDLPSPPMGPVPGHSGVSPQGSMVVIQRFQPGSRVLYTSESGDIEHGTVGQVIHPGQEIAEFRYKVGLSDRVVDAWELQIAPNPEDGQTVFFVEDGFSSSPQEAVAMMVNDIQWPPTYLICIKGGREREANAQQLWLTPPPSQFSTSVVLPSPPSGWQITGYPSSDTPPPIASASSFDSTRAFDSTPADPPTSAPPSYQQPQQLQQPHYPHVTQPPPREAPPPGYTPSAPPPQPPAPAPAPQQLPPAASYAPSAAAAYAPPPTAAYAAPPPTAAYAAPPPPTTTTAGYKPPLSAINNAQKACRTAISALNFEDVSSAVKYLHEALKHLSPQ